MKKAKVSPTNDELLNRLTVVLELMDNYLMHAQLFEYHPELKRKIVTAQQSLYSLRMDVEQLP